ncbi:hypothetical protein DES49_1881 [Halospina denitrificans]|uniref:Outer membrane protein with beta-barrel domain n=2 Tax=Halospina denitrificans TaxID=332522 RepID=A0A4V3EQL5_9GAMM|nr:hypothetical protein DES49_1881 [Halospina denitrificans]
MIRLNIAAITLCLLGALPMAVSAQSSGFGPEEGEGEFSISGTGSSDQDFEGGSLGLSGDLGWYLSDAMSAGIRQSVNYADIGGEGVTDDFWNGSTRGYVNHHFLTDRARPFLGASLGGVYGDGVKDSGFAGLETGIKYYVRQKTYLLARAEYQFLFSSTDEATDAFQDDAIWAYTIGMGYNF